MRKKMRSLFAILMVFAIAITAIPMMEVKAADGDIQVNITFDNTELVMNNDSPNAYITATVEVQGTDKEINNINACYVNKETGEEIWVYFWNIVYGDYTATVGYDHTLESGTYELDFLMIEFTDNSQLYSNRVDDGLSVSAPEFTIKNIAETIPPVISNVSMTPVGAVLGVGDTITIRTTVTDEYSLDESSVSALFIGNDERDWSVNLEKVSGDTYQVEIVIDDEWTGSEWYLYAIAAMDTIGNYAEYNPVEYGDYYNVFVKDANGDYEKVTYQNISFIFTDEKGDYTDDDIIVRNEVAPVISVADILGENCDPNNHELLGDFIGWSINDSEEIISSNELFAVSYDNEEIYIRPVYDKNYVMVDRLILDEEGDSNWTGYEMFFVDKETTYGDLLKQYPAAENVLGCNFLSWEYDNEVDLTEKVSNGEWISLNAIYDKNYVMVDRFILDEEGDSDWTGYEMFFVDKEITYGDLLKQYPAAENVLGCNFLGWEYDDNEVDLTEKISNGEWIDLYATYDKKYIMVNRLIRDEEGDSDWTGYEMFFVDKEITYGDLLKQYPAAENVLGCNFLGWEYDDNEVDLTEKISNGEWIDLYAIYDKNYVMVDRFILDEEGDSDWTGYEMFVVDKETTYGDLLKQYPAAENVLGCNFLGWEYRYEMDLNEKVSNGEWIDLYAKYDNYPVFIERVYVDQTGEVKVEEIKDIYPAGTKIEDILKKYKVIPDDASDEPFEWIESYYETGVVSSYNNYISLIADYEEYMFVRLYMHYIRQSDGYGVDTDYGDYFLVDKSFCLNASDLIKYFEERIIPNFDIKHFSGYEFEEWVFYAYEGENDYYSDLSMWAKYDKSKVITIEMSIGEDEDYEYRYYIVEPGDIITLPTEYAGYYLNWYMFSQIEGPVEFDGYQYTVPDNIEKGTIIEFMAENGEKVPEQVTPPADNLPVDNAPADNAPTDNAQVDNAPADVPPTGDTTNTLLYVAVIFLGAGALMTANKRRKFLR